MPLSSASVSPTAGRVGHQPASGRRRKSRQCDRVLLYAVRVVLFPEPLRERVTPLGHAEPVVHWLTESTRPEAAASRAVVNDWYQRFPDTDGKFGARLRSEVDADHHQSLDELFVFVRLTAADDDVRYEEGGRGPDFRVYRQDQLRGAVEVASLFQQQQWTDEEQRFNRLADAVNARVSAAGGYFVELEPRELSRQPSLTKLSAFIESRIASLPRPSEPRDPGAIGLPRAVYRESGVRIELTFLPMRPDAPSLKDATARVVGAGPVIGGMVIATERLRDRIRSKAGKRYDIGDASFMVAVGIHDSFCDDWDVEGALFGSRGVVISTKEWTRQNDGLFGRDRERPEGRQRRLSAVAAISRLRVWEPNAARVYLLHNPHPRHEWPDDVLVADRRAGWQDGDDGERRFLVSNAT